MIYVFPKLKIKPTLPDTACLKLSKEPKSGLKSGLNSDKKCLKPSFSGPLSIPSAHLLIQSFSAKIDFKTKTGSLNRGANLLK